MASRRVSRRERRFRQPLLIQTCPEAPARRGIGAQSGGRGEVGFFSAQGNGWADGAFLLFSILEVALSATLAWRSKPGDLP